VRTIRANLLLSLIAACASLTAAGQQAATTPPQTPTPPQPPLTFKVEVNYVEIDAIVTDASGSLVQGLTKDDFQLLENGKPQTLSVFSQVDIPVERADAPLFAPSPIEPDVRSNRREFDGRVFVLVLDDLQTHFSRSARVKAAATQFIERHMGANDLAAVVTTGGAKGGTQEFTTSRRMLLQAVDKFMGQKNRSATLEKIEELSRRPPGITGPAVDPFEAERAFKARNSLGTLKGLAEYMAGIRGRRKAVVMFSEGVDYDLSNPIENQYATDIYDEARTAIAAASRANVSFYTVDPRGLGGLDEAIEIQALPGENTLGLTSMMDEVRNAQDSLRVLAEQTGGFAVINQNDYRNAFSKIITENSTYYVLGYYSSDTRRDGQFRPVSVRVNKPGLEVRARKGYTASRGRLPAESKTAAAAETSRELRDALASPIPVTGLGLTAFAAPFRGGNKASVSIALEIEGRRFRFEEKDGQVSNEVEVSMVAFDAGGTSRDGGRDKVILNPRPQTRDLIMKNGVRVLRRLELSPGRYQIRIGAREKGTGALGSVMLDLDVPDFGKEPLSMSGIALTAPSASYVPTAKADDLFKNVLPAAPTAIREFPRADTLAIFTEIYDNQTRAPHRVAIKTTVIADDGRIVFTASDERRSEELGAKGGGYGYTAEIPLQAIPPGRYVLRVEAQTLLSGGGTAKRELEFRVK
jgi:VWFA-related protein